MFKYTIKNGESQTELSSVPASSVDLVVTSPPYKNEDGFEWEIMSDVMSGCYKALKLNTLCFVNFGHLANYKTRPLHFSIMMEDIGFSLHDTIVWVKNHYTPLQGNNLNNLFEYVFMFRKGDCPPLDRLSIGVPYADKSNVGRYSDKDIKCGGNVWYVNYPTIQQSAQKLHKDRFPVELPLKCIKLAHPLESAQILDPFCGSGTTGVAAAIYAQDFNKNISFLGIDKHSPHCIMASGRLENHVLNLMKGLSNEQRASTES